MSCHEFHQCSDTLCVVVFPACCKYMRWLAEVRLPVLIHGTKRRVRWTLMLETCSFRLFLASSWPVLAQLHWTQHGSGFSVCCVIGPWPAFWAPDPWPNETVSPVPFVRPVPAHSLLLGDNLFSVVFSLYADCGMLRCRPVLSCGFKTGSLAV